MTRRSVLISGAGIAGPTLAYWLAQHGYRPTLVERAAAHRSSGSPIDVRGEALGVVERMGVMAQVRAASTQVRELVFVNAAGKRTGGMPLQRLEPLGGTHEVELPRGDLAAILQASVRDHAELLHGDSISTLQQDHGGVDITFEHAPPRRFDLVIGADGSHSAVRRLVFGPERAFVQHAGMYVATAPLRHADVAAHEVLMYNTPGRALALHPSRGRALAAFMFRAREAGDFDYRAGSQHKRLLSNAYAHAGWRVPELLAEALDSEELYFDAVCRVRVPRWSQGRVALLGDAASSVTLFGDGSSSAITGAFTLAAALAAQPDDHQAAFRSYEQRQRRSTDPKQKHMWIAAALLVPSSELGIRARNGLTRLAPLRAALLGVQRMLTGAVSSG